jgi:hypothetical protein
LLPIILIILINPNFAKLFSPSLPQLDGNIMKKKDLKKKKPEKKKPDVRDSLYYEGDI